MDRNILREAGAALSAIALIACGTAYAESSKWYAGIGAGQSDWDISSSDVNKELAAAGITGTSSVDETDTAWKIFAGYQHNKYLGVELGYVDLGEIDIDATTTAPTASTVNVNAEADGFTLSAIGTIPIGDKFGLFGRVGAFYWDVEAKAAAVVSGAVATASADDDGTDIFYGVGAKYDFTKNLGVRVEWERFDIDGDDVDLVSGSLLYSF